MKQHLPAARSARPSPAKRALELAGKIRAMSADQRGVAAIEFGIFSVVLALALANVRINRAPLQKFLRARLRCGSPLSNQTRGTMRAVVCLLARACV